MSTCITDGHGKVIDNLNDVTPEDDYPRDLFAHGKYVGYLQPLDSAYWFEGHYNSFNHTVVYKKREDLLVANDTNAS